MIKKSIFTVIVTLFLTACVAERGAMVPVKITESHVKKYIEKNETIPTLVLRSSRKDALQENISASLILIIGLILIL